MKNLGPPVDGRAFLLMASAILSLSLCLVHAAEAPAPAAVTSVSVTDAWARATPPGMSVGAAYLAITNRSMRADALLGASSPVAAAVQIHRTVLEGGVSRMRPAGEIVIAPGDTIRIEPGGLHLMLVGLSVPLVEGRSLPLTLEFRNAGSVTVQVAIRPLVDVPMHGGH